MRNILKETGKCTEYSITTIIKYADLSKRLCAHLFDVLLIYIATLVLLLISGIISDAIYGDIDNIVFLILVLIIFPWYYHAKMESSFKQATLGKILLGIMVTDMNGNRLSFGKATVRFWTKIISAITVIGFIIVLFTKKKQALHDIIADTLVINKK